jgi:hypothetical protein
MELKMIRYGMLAGLGFLLAMAAIEWLATRPGGTRIGAGGGLEADVSTQVWAVLAEARKITEDSA